MESEPKRKGPFVKLSLILRCEGCEFLQSEYYCIEDGNDVDSGFNHRCAHLAVSERLAEDAAPHKNCPFLAEALLKAVRRPTDK